MCIRDSLTTSRLLSQLFLCGTWVELEIIQDDCDRTRWCSRSLVQSKRNSIRQLIKSLAERNHADIEAYFKKVGDHLATLQANLADENYNWSEDLDYELFEPHKFEEYLSNRFKIRVAELSRKDRENLKLKYYLHMHEKTYFKPSNVVKESEDLGGPLMLGGGSGSGSGGGASL
eukprot:TRINITY_DN8088_c0_g1_i1.p1 TRINITY_DN8088_c0_g1~~TRINITY_DN8088_c0_g1_i1.p1  ORF type:complete len:196 (-),score=51.58 TRINITY_DN8088_c0_g1_i1:287-808(-)